MLNTKILFVIDELEYKWFEDNKLVTNFWFIKEFLKSGLHVDITTKRNLFIANAKGWCKSNEAQLIPNNITYKKEQNCQPIENYNVVFFRPDPPVDIDYINACNVFEFVDRNKTKLINDPIAIKNFNEKMHVNLFPQFAPRNIVTSSKEQIIDFINNTEKAIIKPLNRCFGSGVFILNKSDANTSSIISAATENEKTLVMVQEYLKGAINGDKRILIIGEKVMEESVKKLPAPNDFKFAEHSDKFFEKSPLTQEEKTVAQAIAKKLNQLRLPLAGLDMIDSKVIEINITSPCYFIKEINNLYNTNFENKIIPEILSLAGIEIKQTITV